MVLHNVYPSNIHVYTSNINMQTATVIIIITIGINPHKVHMYVHREICSSYSGYKIYSLLEDIIAERLSARLMIVH